MYKDLRYRFQLIRSLKHHVAHVPPQKVQIEITNACNLRCTMCDRWKWSKEDTKTAEMLSTQRLNDLFQELARLGVTTVLLTGGEPLLREDFSILVEHLSYSGMNISLFTNGTCMDQEKAKVLASADAKVIFSIDGYKETHDRIRGVNGTFEKALQGIQNLTKARKGYRSENEILMNFTVQKDNIQDMVSCFKLANEMGVDTTMYNLVHGKPEVAPGKENMAEIQEAFKTLIKLEASSKTRVDFGDLLRAFIEEKVPMCDVERGLPTVSLFRDNPVPCLAAYNSSFIDSFGRVFPCCYCYLDNFPYSPFEKERGKFYLGNILETDFAEIWHGDRYDKFRAQTDPIDITELSFFCGQCYEYFAFKRSYRRFLLYGKTGLLR